MFVRSRLKTVAVFTPPALPGFLAMPTAIPDQTLFCRSSCTVVRHTRCAVQSLTKNCLAAWLASAHRVLLDAVWDPGCGQHVLVSSDLLLLPASSTKSSAHPNSEHNGANYQIQRLTLHLAAFVHSVFLQTTLAPEFPLLTLSIASRVPSCRIAAVTHFDEHTGWLTTPFLRGHPPL